MNWLWIDIENRQELHITTKLQVTVFECHVIRFIRRRFLQRFDPMKVRNTHTISERNRLLILMTLILRCISKPIYYNIEQLLKMITKLRPPTIHQIIDLLSERWLIINVIELINVFQDALLVLAEQKTIRHPDHFSHFNATDRARSIVRRTKPWHDQVMTRLVPRVIIVAELKLDISPIL